MTLSFTKMQGLGNDFIFIAQKANPHLSPAALPALAKALARRRFAVGGRHCLSFPLRAGGFCNGYF